MKKIIAIILAISVFVTLGIAFTACSKNNKDSNPGDPHYTQISDITGTYKLTEYVCNVASTEAGDPVKTNVLERDGLVAYLTLTEDGYGYYAYKDNNTGYLCESIYIEYSKDDEEKNYTTVTFKTGKDLSNSEVIPTPGETYTYDSPLSLVFNKENKTLTYVETSGIIYPIENTIQPQNIKYTRESTSNGFDYLKEITDEDFDIQSRYELKYINGYFYYETENEVPGDEYKYQVLFINTKTNKFSLYKQPVEGARIDVSGDLEYVYPNKIGVALELKFDDYSFEIKKGIASTFLRYEKRTGTEGHTSMEYAIEFISGNSEGKSLDDYCQELEEKYDQEHTK